MRVDHRRVQYSINLEKEQIFGNVWNGVRSCKLNKLIATENSMTTLQADIPDKSVNLLFDFCQQNE